MWVSLLLWIKIRSQIYNALCWVSIVCRHNIFSTSAGFNMAIFDYFLSPRSMLTFWFVTNVHVCAYTCARMCTYVYVCMHVCGRVWCVHTQVCMCVVCACSQYGSEEVYGLEEPHTCQVGSHFPPLFLLATTQAPRKHVSQPCWAEDMAMSVQLRTHPCSCQWDSCSWLWYIALRLWFPPFCLWICSLIFLWWCWAQPFFLHPCRAERLSPISFWTGWIHQGKDFRDGNIWGMEIANL